MSLVRGFFAGTARLFIRRHGFLREGTDEQDELPALVFGHALFEGGHGLSTLADLVEERTVGDGVHVLRVGEIGWFGIVAQGFGAVALAAVAMTIRAVFPVESFGGLERRFGRLQRIPAGLGFFRDKKKIVILKVCVSDGDENESQKQNEKGFSRSGLAGFVCGHGSQ